MPGLLDMFGSADPQTQGLLAAAAGILNASGPSLMPRSFGQVMGAGLTGYQQGQALAQQQALRDLQMKGAQMDLDQHQAALDMQNRIRQRSLADAQGTLTPQQAPAAGTPAAPAPSMASAMPGGLMSPKTGGPDWMQAWQTSEPAGLSAAAPQSSAAPAGAAALPSSPSLTQTVVARLTRQAQIHAEEGDMDGANKLYEQATKFMPEVNKIEVGMSNGKPVNVITYKDGRQEVSQYDPKPDIHFADDGQHTAIPVNGYTGQTMGPGLVRQATPGEVLNSRQAAERLAFDKSQADSNQDAPLDPLAVRLVAQQYLAGDKTALQNYGRGTQGAKNLNLIRGEIAKQAIAAGMNGGDVAAKIAEFEGIKSGQRTAGTRSANIEIAANEAGQLAPLALEASAQVARSGLLPFGKAQIMFDSNTNDPNLRRFAMANQALVTAYAQAISRGGAATVSDKQHAQDLLSTAQDQPSYAAAVGQMMKEIDAARSAPKAVRGAISAGVSGRESGPQQPPTAGAGGKVATLSDIAETARKSGKTTKQVTADLRAAGYTIGGQ